MHHAVIDSRNLDLERDNTAILCISVSLWSVNQPQRRRGTEKSSHHSLRARHSARATVSLHCLSQSARRRFERSFQNVMRVAAAQAVDRSEENTSELQS